MKDEEKEAETKGREREEVTEEGEKKKTGSVRE